MIGKIGMFILAWIGLSFLVGGLYALVNYLDYQRKERQRAAYRGLPNHWDLSRKEWKTLEKATDGLLGTVTGRHCSCLSNCKEKPRGAVPLDRTITTKEFTPYRKKEPRA